MNNPDCVPVAGGLSISQELNAYPELLDLSVLDELKHIKRTENSIQIGALVTLAKILDIGPKVLPEVLILALKRAGVPSLRNMITLGGAVCSCSRSSDILPPLYLLEAELEIRSQAGTRYIPINLFCREEGINHLQPGEILTRVFIPLKQYDIAVYEKLFYGYNPFKPVMTFCAGARITKRQILELNFAYGAINPIVLRNKLVEAAIQGRNLPLTQKDRNLIGNTLQTHLKPGTGLADQNEYLIQSGLRYMDWFLLGLKTHLQ